METIAALLQCDAYTGMDGVRAKKAFAFEVKKHGLFTQHGGKSLIL